MERPKCDTCAYRWEPQDGDKPHGTCHRNPVMIVWSDRAGATSGYPGIPKMGWCGEHQDFPKYLKSLEQKED